LQLAPSCSGGKAVDHLTASVCTPCLWLLFLEREQRFLFSCLYTHSHKRSEGTDWKVSEVSPRRNVNCISMI
jgi:hypothetical protein